MPPSPKILQTQRSVRLIKVVGKLKAEKKCYSYCNVAIAAEVSVDLQSVTIDADLCF